MTVELEYDLPEPKVASQWQIDVADEIATNQSSASNDTIATTDIVRELDGSTLRIRLPGVATLSGLSSSTQGIILTAVQNQIAAASHVQTHEV